MDILTWIPLKEMSQVIGVLPGPKNCWCLQDDRLQMYHNELLQCEALIMQLQIIGWDKRSSRDPYPQDFCQRIVTEVSALDLGWRTRCI